MNYEKLKDLFNEKADEIKSQNESTARFRAGAYSRVANKIEAAMDLKDPVTENGINSMELSDYMKSKAIEFMNNSSIHAKSPSRTKSSGRKKSSKAVSTNNKAVSRAKSSSRKKSSKAIITNNKAVSRAKSSSRKKSSKTKDAAKDNNTDADKSTDSKLDAKSELPGTHAKLIKELSGFMGLGPEKAKALIEAGVRNVNQLHLKKYKELLPEETKIFMELKPIQKIPREHIKILEPHLLKASDETVSLTITGSYRREKPFSSDIDLMVVSDNENAIELLLERLKKILEGKVYPYSKGKDKMSLIVDMSNLLEAGSGSYVYKIDAFKTSPENSIPMLLYSTGSKEFNVSMRSKAKKMGYLLNQKGLFKDGIKINNLNSEEDYFEILDMTYKKPKERI